MRNYIYIFTILFFISCKPEGIKFNKAVWNYRNDTDYNHRELMIEDLSKNHLKSGAKFHDVEKLLGSNEFVADSDSLQLQYEIYTYYGTDIDPIETKNLIVNFNSDSTLTNIRIEHWKK